MDGTTKRTLQRRIEALEKAVFGLHLDPDQSRLDDEEAMKKVHFIWRLVCKRVDIPIAWMRIRCRTKKIAFYRNVAMHLCLKFSGLSQGQLATAFNRKNHTTILCARNRILHLMARKKAVRDLVMDLESEFQKAHSALDTRAQSTAVFPTALHEQGSRGSGTGL